MLAELLADKFPIVDHFLDAVQSFVKPVAGTILMASVLSELTPLQATVLGLIAGGTAAGAVHMGKAKLRLASSVTTAGHGQPGSLVHRGRWPRWSGASPRSSCPC